MKRLIFCIVLVLVLTSCNVANNADDTVTYTDTITQTEVITRGETTNCKETKITKVKTSETTNVEKAYETTESISTSESEENEADRHYLTLPLDKVDVNGFDITVDDLKQIIKCADTDMHIINGCDDTFNLTEGKYLNYNDIDFFDVINSFNDVFSKESDIAEEFISSLTYEKIDSRIKISRVESDGYIPLNIDEIKKDKQIKSIIIEGGIGANPTFLRNEFEIINRSENKITLKNTAYYNEENENPIQIFEYNMVLEEGTWKFLNFECWY